MVYVLSSNLFCVFVLESTAQGKGIYTQDQLIRASMFMMWYVPYTFGATSSYMLSFSFSLHFLIL